MIEEIRQSAKDIHDFLSGVRQLERGRLAELARCLDQAGEVLNGKIATCRKLLQMGRRGEAVRLARSSPDLRESVSLLDTEDSQGWLETCDALSLASSRRLDAEQARGLVAELYDSSAQTGELLRTYRRLSLAMAGVSDRLRVLRRLYLTDHDSEKWADDVKAFETARIEELARRAEQADRQGDLDGLEAILSELRAQDWVDRPSGKFVAAVEARALPHRRRLADRRYRALLEEARKAHAAMDESACTRIAEEWLAVKDQVGVGPEQAAADEFAAVRAWLDELAGERDQQSAFDRACAALETAVEEEHGLHALDKLVADLLRLDRGMPELLAARVNTRLAELRQASRRRFFVTVASIVCGVVLLGLAAVMAVNWNARAQELKRWHTRIAAALDQGDIEAAERLMGEAKKNSPDVFASPEIQSLANKHFQKAAEDAARKRDFDAAIKAVGDAGPEIPDAAALERAVGLARSFEEKSVVQDWRERIARCADEQRRNREAEIDKLVADLEAAHAGLAEAGRYDTGDVESLCDGCLRLAKEVSVAEGITSLQKAKIAAMEQSAIRIRDESRKNRTRRQAVRAALERMRSAGNDPPALTAALQSFAKNYPEHPLAAEFVQASRLASAWQPVASWATVRAGWRTVRVDDAATAAARLEAVETHLRAYPSGPQVTAIYACRDYLKAAVRALPEGRLRNAAAIEESLTHPLVADVLMLALRDGRRFYLIKPDLVESKINNQVVSYMFSYVVDERCTLRTGYARPEEMTAMPAPAPQAALSGDALLAVRGFKGAGWETFYLKLALQAINNTAIDAVLRASITRSLLDYAIDISPVRMTQAEHAANVLQKQYVPVRWMHPDDTEAMKTRLQTAKILEGMADRLKDAESAVEKALLDMESALKRYRPAGILLGPSDALESAGLPDKGCLFVVTDAGQGQYALRKIGSVAGGKAAVNAQAGSGLPRGTMIFATTE